MEHRQECYHYTPTQTRKPEHDNGIKEIVATWLSRGRQCTAINNRQSRINIEIKHVTYNDQCSTIDTQGAQINTQKLRQRQFTGQADWHASYK